MDPIGLALDSYGITGKWRFRENGNALDTRGDFYDGTPITGPVELQQALMKHPIPLVRTFTSNLMAYALGRRVEYFDQPTIRRIVRHDLKSSGAGTICATRSECCRATASISRASVASIAMRASTSTCFPASSAATVYSRCR